MLTQAVPFGGTVRVTQLLVGGIALLTVMFSGTRRFPIAGTVMLAMLQSAGCAPVQVQPGGRGEARLTPPPSGPDGPKIVSLRVSGPV